MGVTKRRRRGREGATAPWWWVGLAVLLGLLGTGGFWVADVLSSRVTLDEATLCPETGAVGVQAILLDLTDPLSAAQAERLQALLERKVEGVAPRTMVSVGIVSENNDNWGARFARCKPATGEDANALHENPTLIAERFERKFSKPLRATIAEMMQGEPQSRSPIIEALQALLAETPYVLDEQDNLSVVVASDLLQHSDTLSFYAGEGWDQLAASGATDRLARNLDGAEITLIRIPRPSAGDTARAQVDGFWTRYLDQQGASAPFEVVTLGDL